MHGCETIDGIAVDFTWGCKSVAHTKKGSSIPHAEARWCAQTGSGVGQLLGIDPESYWTSREKSPSWLQATTLETPSMALRLSTIEYMLRLPWVAPKVAWLPPVGSETA